MVQFAHERDKLIEEKKRLEEKVFTSLREGFFAYLEEVERGLSTLTASQHEKAARLEARQRFEEARHRDSAVMTLYEQRVELQKFLRQASVPLVREQLQAALDRCEAEIESRFPGALAVEDDVGGASEEVVEIFFVGDAQHVNRLFLPISKRTWEALRDTPAEAYTSDQLSALRVVWGLGKWLADNGVDLRLVRIVEQGEMFVMLVKTDVSKLRGAPTIPLPGSGELTVAIRKLPEDVERALKYES